MLGDEYIAQHIAQAYREHLEQRSYKLYMSSMAKGIAQGMTGAEVETSWGDIIAELDEAVTPVKKQTETAQEIKTRLLAKLNGKGVA